MSFQVYCPIKKPPLQCAASDNESLNVSVLGNYFGAQEDVFYHVFMCGDSQETGQ